MDPQPRWWRIGFLSWLIGIAAGAGVHFGCFHRPLRLGGGGLELDPQAFSAGSLVFPLVLMPAISAVTVLLVLRQRRAAGRRPPPPLPDPRPGELVHHGGPAAQLGRVFHLDGINGTLWLTDQRLRFRSRWALRRRDDSLPLAEVEVVEERWPRLPLGTAVLTVRGRDWADRRYLVDRLQRERWLAALRAAGVRLVPVPGAAEGSPPAPT